MATVNKGKSQGSRSKKPVGKTAPRAKAKAKAKTKAKTTARAPAKATAKAKPRAKQPVKQAAKKPVKPTEKKPSARKPPARPAPSPRSRVADVAKISAPPPVAAAAAGGRRPFVLIVDDFADAREMYAEYFEFLSYRVATAENGLEAIEKATAERPDVILMDLSLPVLDGWEATRRLKRDERTRGIPVIALTGNALQGHEELARKAGCDAFLTKPCLPENVEKEILRILVVSRRSVA